MVKQWEIELSLRFQLPCTLHYFDPVGLLGSMLRDPDVMQHFVYYPQEKFTTCGKRIYDETTSAEWFHSAFNESHASEDGKLKAGHLFVGIGLFSDGSAIDKMQKHSEHPLLITMLNLSIECRKKVEAWQLVSLLPDVEISDLEKKSNISDLSKERLAQYHRSTGFLLEPFRDPNKCYELFVHG